MLETKKVSRCHPIAKPPDYTARVCQINIRNTTECFLLNLEVNCSMSAMHDANPVDQPAFVGNHTLRSVSYGRAAAMQMQGVDRLDWSALESDQPLLNAINSASS